MTVPPSALNLDDAGARLSDPKAYGAFVKTRGFAPVSHKITWSSAPAPRLILLGLAVQLKAAHDQIMMQLEQS